MDKSQIPPKSNYLKYWRVIRYYIKAKHGITTPELEMMLFLHSEKYFSQDKFAEFDSLISWDKNRFKRLVRDGWIQSFRVKTGNRRAVYELSRKGKLMVNSVYNYLSGKEIPTSVKTNPLFEKDVSYNDKVYRNMILQMNEFIRQERHHARK
jgi:DNA-binding MarR family transcriptional regulator